MKSKKRNVKKHRMAPTVVAAVQVQKVVLPPTAVLEVALPKGLVPVVLPDPEKGIVKIIPVPAAKLKDKTWFQRWFG